MFDGQDSASVEEQCTSVVQDTVDTLGALGLDLSTKTVDIILLRDIDLDSAEARRLFGVVALHGLFGQASCIDGVSVAVVEILGDLCTESGITAGDDHDEVCWVGEGDHFFVSKRRRGREGKERKEVTGRENEGKREGGE